jgi:hypothetical protein
MDEVTGIANAEGKTVTKPINRITTIEEQHRKELDRKGSIRVSHVVRKLIILVFHLFKLVHQRILMEMTQESDQIRKFSQDLK